MSYVKNVSDAQIGSFVVLDQPSNKFARRVVLDESQKPLPVISVDARNPIIVFEEINAVAGFSTQDVLVFTVPMGNTLSLKSIHVSGDNRAIFEIKNGIIILQKLRTYYTKFDSFAQFFGASLQEGESLIISVENKSNSVADFNCTLQGDLI